MGRLEDLLIGRRVSERYRIDALLGRGGMGVVYRAVDERLDRPVALKVLSPPCGTDAGTHNLRARFRREARAAAAIRHPNVVGIHDYGVDPALDLDYLVMELLTGEDLASVLSRAERPGLDTVLAVLADTASALAAGHARGIVHRDVKPANIFLAVDEGGTRHVRLLDFGIAQDWRDGMETVRRLTQFGQTPLTPAFAAPEQAEGRGDLTPAADVYSLGMTALAMLSDGSPRNRMLDGEVSPIRLSGSRTERGLEAVLARALHLDPRKRFADGQAFAAAVALLRSGSPSVTATATGRANVAPLPAPGAPPPPRGAAHSRRSLRLGRRRAPSPVGRIVAGAVATGVTAVALVSAWAHWPSPTAPATPDAVIGALRPPPPRPWPSLTAAEESWVADRRRSGMGEREALLRLAVETAESCELGGSAEACGRRPEIDALLRKRDYLRVPTPFERKQLVEEGFSHVRDIQDARIAMRIVHPTVHAPSEGSIEDYPARVFVRDRNVYKAVLDVRFSASPFGFRRIVDEYYYDRGGALVYARQRTWSDGPQPIADEGYHYRGGLPVAASMNGEISELTLPVVQLEALLIQRRAVAVHDGVRDQQNRIPVSLEDLFPFME